MESSQRYINIIGLTCCGVAGLPLCLFLQSQKLLVRLLLLTAVVAVLVVMIVEIIVVEIITVLFEQGKGRLDDHLQSLVLKCTRLGGCSCRLYQWRQYGS